MKRRNSIGLITVIHSSTIFKSFLAIFALLLFVFSISAVMTSLKPEYRLSSKSVHTVTNQVTGQMLFSLIANENHYFSIGMTEKIEPPKLSHTLLKLSANISLDDPRSLLGRELPGFSIFDSEILVAGTGTDYTNMPIESAPPLDDLDEKKDAELQNTDDVEEKSEEKNNPSKTTNGRKIVHIYHTHNRESFLPYLKGVTDPNKANHSKINVTKVGEKLAENLEEKGIGVNVDETDFMDKLIKAGLKYPKAYQASREGIETAMATNKDLEYFIDIHRDSHGKDFTTIKINGKNYAKIAFVIGGKNPNYEDNLALANKLHKALEKKYPGLSRGIIKHNSSGNNSLYNQDVSPNAMLIEIGGVGNTFEEMYRTVDAFAAVFSEYYWDAKAVDNVKGNTGAE